MFWNTAKSLFRAGGANYMPVSDLEASATWYKETFGVKPVNIELDDGDAGSRLGFGR